MIWLMSAIAYLLFAVFVALFVLAGTIADLILRVEDLNAQLLKAKDPAFGFDRLTTERAAL